MDEILKLTNKVVGVLKSKLTTDDVFSENPYAKILWSIWRELDKVIELVKLTKLKNIKKEQLNAVSNEHYKAGTIVSIRPCDEKYKNKTFIGIMIGELPRRIKIDPKSEEVKISASDYNPAILVPELNKIFFGFESWWGEINEEDITDETIQNVWYVKLFKQMNGLDS